MPDKVYEMTLADLTRLKDQLISQLRSDHDAASSIVGRLARVDAYIEAAEESKPNALHLR